VANERDKMRITFVLPYAGLAGGIRVIAIYAQQLQRRGHNVTVISTPWSPPGRRARAIHGMRRWLHKLSVLDKRDPSHFQGVKVEHIQIREDRSIGDADVPDGDVVVATWWETARWVAALAPEKGAKAYFVQDYGAHDGQPLDKIAQTWELPLHKIAISRWILGLIEQYSGESEVDYVPNAVDSEQFFAPPRNKQPRATVGFVFNPAPQKGCDIVFEAVRLARQSIPELRVVAYGPGDPCMSNPLPPETEYWQYAPEDKLREIYAECDAWLFASRREGFGLPILEAMACRTPVVAMPAGAAPELLADGGGLLVRPDDARDMARAIVQINSMSDLEWQAMSDAALATATGYSWEHATDQFEMALRRAITKSKPAELTVASNLRA
jgi:glycosyltransferase involved in cell wall biosynthesis